MQQAACGTGGGGPCNAAAGGGGEHPGPCNAGGTSGGTSGPAMSGPCNAGEPCCNAGGKVSGQCGTAGSMGSERKSSTNTDLPGPDSGAMYSFPELSLHTMALPGISFVSHLLVWRDLEYTN